MRFPYTRYQAEPAAFDPARQIIELPHIPITLVAAAGKAVRISIDVGDHRLQIGAYFSNLWSNDFAILGRKDFFEHFNVLFDETKKVIELTPSR